MRLEQSVGLKLLARLTSVNSRRRKCKRKYQCIDQEIVNGNVPSKVQLDSGYKYGKPKNVSSSKLKLIKVEE
jgi:hypothetical protein